MPKASAALKASASNFGRLLNRLADRLARAASQVTRAVDEEICVLHASAESGRRQLSDRGLLHRASDGREGLLLNGIFYPLHEPVRKAEHPTVRYVDAVLAASKGLLGIRASDPTAWGFTFSARRLRKTKKARGGERTDMKCSAQGLIRWLASQGVTAGMGDQIVVGAHGDPTSATIIAGMHLSCATARTRGLSSCSGNEECPVVAVSRALSVVVLGLDTPLRTATRQLANDAFDVAATLMAIVRRLEEENPGLEGDVVQNLAALSRLLAALEREIRSHCLTSYYDQAPRGKRPRQAILIDAQRHLSRGGFSDTQIAALLDDGLPRARRVRRVGDLLNLKPTVNGTATTTAAPNTWIGYADAATPEQIERAERESELEWL